MTNKVVSLDRAIVRAGRVNRRFAGFVEGVADDGDIVGNGIMFQRMPIHHGGA